MEEKIKRCRACLTKAEVMYHLEESYKSKDEEVKTLWQLLRACASVQGSSADEFPRYICHSCLKKASEAYQFRLQCENADLLLKAELESLNRENKKFELCDSEDRPKLQECDVCGKQLASRSGMAKHRKKHGTATATCSFCHAAFPSSILLARHMEQLHSHLKTLKCSVCDKSFFKKANLKLHMNVHSNVKRHMCEVCGVSFALAGNLNAHRRLHTGLKPYTCERCGRGFAQQSALRSHEAGHSDRKDHVCAQCGAAFSRAGALRNHCKRHLPVRPFACGLCGRAFTFSNEMKRHMTVHTGEKNHECDVCGSRFNRRTNLVVHRRIHTGDMPHSCSECGRKFNQAHCLRTHMAVHQKKNA